MIAVIVEIERKIIRPLVDLEVYYGKFISINVGLNMILKSACNLSFVSNLW